jgi:acyl-CoA thioesterase-1
MKSLVHSFTVTLLALAGFVGVFTLPASAQGGAPLKIVAFGDSLTAGYGLPAQDAFPAKLQAALRAKGHNVEIENAGVSGDTASGGLSRLDWSVQDGTDAVIVELGANDMLRGVDPKVTRQALDDILANLKARKIPVLLAGMRAAPNMGADYARDFESIFTDLAAKYDVVFYPFFLDGVAAQAKLALRDGVHPNGAGVDIIVAGILPKTEELIALVKKRTPS